MMGQIEKTVDGKDDERNKENKSWIFIFLFLLIFGTLCCAFLASFLSTPTSHLILFSSPSSGSLGPRCVSGAGHLGCTGCRGQETSETKKTAHHTLGRQRQFVDGTCLPSKILFFTTTKKRPRNGFLTYIPPYLLF